MQEPEELIRSRRRGRDHVERALEAVPSKVVAHNQRLEPVLFLNAWLIFALSLLERHDSVVVLHVEQVCVRNGAARWPGAPAEHAAKHAEEAGEYTLERRVRLDGCGGKELDEDGECDRADGGRVVNLEGAENGGQQGMREDGGDRTWEVWMCDKWT